MNIVTQIMIDAKVENEIGAFDTEDSNLSGIITIEREDEINTDGTYKNAYEISQTNLFDKYGIQNVKRVAIQGEAGLRFSFQGLVDPVEADEEKLEQKIENACVTMSTVGFYEIDCIGFKLNLNSLYIYLPKNKYELSKNIYIDILYEGGTNS